MNDHHRSSADPRRPENVRLTLDNGLQLILREDRSAPVVSLQAWCRAGSIHEGEWLGAGLSHVLEHMLFKGTERRPPGRIDQEVQAVGGSMNAYTSFDRTVYWINTPAEGMPVALDVLCDIFQSATLPPDELTKELDVIRREMDMCEDDPGRKSSRRLFESAYRESPFRYPVIGLRPLFDQIDRAAIAGYYRDKYSPNNCFLVGVGDFDPRAVADLAAKHFANARPRPLPSLPLPLEPRRIGPSEASDEGPVELGHFHLAWHTPDLLHPDTPALDALAVLLGGGRSSRLHQAVRERASLVHSISAWNYTPSREGLFGVSGVCDGPKFAPARDAALAEIERVAVHGVTEPELAKAVRQFLAGHLSALKTMEGQAQDLGSSWLSAHDLEFGERYLESVRRLRPEDLQRVAQGHLRIDRRIVYSLLPRAEAAPSRPRPAASRGPAIQKLELANGARLLVRQDRRLPLVSIRAAFAGGVLFEDAANSGETALMGRLLVKGSPGKSAEQIASEMESLGGSLDPFSGNHSFGLSADVLGEAFTPSLALFLEVLRRPTFPAAELEREREAQLAAIRGQRDHLLSCAFRQVRRQLFGAGGYGLDAIGTEETVKRFTSEDLRRLHNRLAVPNNAVFAVFGDVDPEEVRATFESALAGWAPGEIPVAGGMRPLASLPSKQVEERDKEQAVVVLGFPGVTMNDPEQYPLELIEEACSSMGSRLFTKIRDELGLAYYVGASHFAGRLPGYFGFYCGTAPGEAARVEEELRVQAAALSRDGLTAEELDRAKAKVIGQKKIGLQDQSALAMQAALDELSGLGFDRYLGDDARYAAVSSEAVAAAAARFFRPELSAVGVQLGKQA